MQSHFYTIDTVKATRAKAEAKAEARAEAEDLAQWASANVSVGLKEKYESSVSSYLAALVKAARH